jgi:hypothetical protein
MLRTRQNRCKVVRGEELLVCRATAHSVHIGDSKDHLQPVPHSLILRHKEALRVVQLPGCIHEVRI